jgi:hypothetical protein
LGLHSLNSTASGFTAALRRTRDRARLYFECRYVDARAKEIKAHTFSDDNLMRVGGKWLIKEMKAGNVPRL